MPQKWGATKKINDEMEAQNQPLLISNNMCQCRKSTAKIPSASAVSTYSSKLNNDEMFARLIDCNLVYFYRFVKII